MTAVYRVIFTDRIGVRLDIKRITLDIVAALFLCASMIEPFEVQEMETF